MLSFTPNPAARSGGIVATVNAPARMSSIVSVDWDHVTGKPSELDLILSPPWFAVDKNGTNQTGVPDSTYTTVTWSRELEDRGNYFFGNGWTPPAGVVNLTAQAVLSGTWASGNLLLIAICKNGTPVNQGNWRSSAANVGGASLSINDYANGTDIYTVQVYADTDAGTATVSGNTSNTFFRGAWLGP